MQLTSKRQGHGQNFFPPRCSRRNFRAHAHTAPSVHRTNARKSSQPNALTLTPHPAAPLAGGPPECPIGRRNATSRMTSVLPDWTSVQAKGSRPGRVPLSENPTATFVMIIDRERPTWQPVEKVLRRDGELPAERGISAGNEEPRRRRSGRTSESWRRRVRSRASKPRRSDFFNALPGNTKEPGSAHTHRRIALSRGRCFVRHCKVADANQRLTGSAPQHFSQNVLYIFVDVVQIANILTVDPDRSRRESI